MYNSIQVDKFTPWGPSIKDVRKGGGGVGPNADKIGRGGVTAVQMSAAKFNIML